MITFAPPLKERDFNLERYISGGESGGGAIREERVLVLLGDSYNAGEVTEWLRDAGIDSVRCASMEELCERVSEGGGAIVLDAAALSGDQVQRFDRCLINQPRWSDIPVVLLSGQMESLHDALESLQGLESSSSFSILTKPVAESSLVTATKRALRSRRQQYEVRNLLKELGDREEQFRLIVDSAVEYAIFSTDNEGRITSWNSGAERLLGYSEEEILGKRGSLIFTEEDRDAGVFDAEMERARKAGTAADNRWHVRRDGSRFWADGQVSPMYGPDGEIKGFAKILRDYTGRRRTESWLKALNETLEKRVEERTAVAERRAGLLRRLANELTKAEQRERRRLAQVLHDHLQQLLVAAKMQLGVMSMREGDSERGDNLHQVEDLIKRSIETSRSLTVELSPPILYDAGLGPALEWLSRRMRETHGLEVDLNRETDLGPTEENVRVFLFEAIRELLFNVVKHSGVDKSTVTLREGGDLQLEAEVHDAGKGLDLNEAGGADSGFGLFSIRERIELLGGGFEVKSEPGGGTVVFLRVPISQAEEPEEPETAQKREAEKKPGEEKRVEDEKAEERDRVRILLADDHKILREGLAGLLREQSDFDVVSEASDGQMAVTLALETRPDVIVMDVTMPRLNGIDATRRIMQELPHVKVIGLSMHEKEDMAQAMREAGAVAYVTKGAPSDILTATIRDCAASANGNSADTSFGSQR